MRKMLKYVEDVAAYSVRAATNPRVANRVIIYTSIDKLLDLCLINPPKPKQAAFA